MAGPIAVPFTIILHRNIESPRKMIYIPVTTHTYTHIQNFIIIKDIYIYNYYYTVYSIITHISLHTPVVFGNNVIYIYYIIDFLILLYIFAL